MTQIALRLFHNSINLIKEMLVLNKKIRAFELVNDYEEVVTNVRQFHKDLENGSYMVGKLSQFKEWFYIPELDAFGPSKFIGYKEMNAVFYNNGHRSPEQKQMGCKALSGGTSTNRLKRWFREVTKDESLFYQLYCKLESSFSTYDKKPNNSTQIFSLKKALL